jgi:hypothetical protein
VLIDGEPAGLSPIERRAVAAGEHEISIDDRCHQQTSARVALASGDERTVDLEVIPRRSSIDVRARDEKGAALEAEVSLDGEPLGPAPNLWQIPTCARVVDVRAPGYSRFRVDVIAQEGKTQRIEAVLKAEGTGWASSGSGDTGRRRRGAAVAGDTAAEETIGGQGANGPVDGAPPRLATVDHGWLRLGLGAAVSVYCGERRGTESDCSATYTGGGALGSIVVFADSVVQLEARAGVMYFAAPKEQPELSPIIEVPLSAGAAVDVMRVAGKGTPGWFFLALELAYSHRSAVNARTLSTFAEDELGIGGGMWVRVSSLELGFSLHAPVTTEAGLLTGRIWLGYSFAIL